MTKVELEQITMKRSSETGMSEEFLRELIEDARPAFSSKNYGTEFNDTYHEKLRRELLEDVVDTPGAYPRRNQ